MRCAHSRSETMIQPGPLKNLLARPTQSADPGRGDPGRGDPSCQPVKPSRMAAHLSVVAVLAHFEGCDGAVHWFPAWDSSQAPEQAPSCNVGRCAGPRPGDRVHSNTASPSGTPPHTSHHTQWLLRRDAAPC